MTGAPDTEEPQPKQLSMPQRLALRMLHTGALFQGPGMSWTCRAFPHQAVQIGTIRCLAERGLVRFETHGGLYGAEFRAVVLTEAGRAEPLGKPARPATPPPAAAETVIRSVEQAMGEMAAREDRLSRVINALGAEARATRAAASRIELRLAAIEESARKADHERATLASCRTDLRAFTTQACEQIGATLAEARR